MSTSYEEILKIMKEKDFDEDDVIIEGSYLDGDEYLREANQAIRISIKYLKEVEILSSTLADGLAVK